MLNFNDRFFYPILIQIMNILRSPLNTAFLAHLSHWLMVSYCDKWMCRVRFAWCVVRRLSSTIASKDICSQTTGWILTKLDRNDPYMAIFKKCSNGSCLLHI